MKERKHRKHHIVRNDASGERLDRFLPQVFQDLSRTEARKQISAGHIWINGKPSRVQSRKLKNGDRITWKRPKEESSSSGEIQTAPSKVFSWEDYGGEPDFLYRDRHMAIMNKRSGIPIEPTPKEDIRTCLRQVEAFLRQSGIHPSKIYAAAAHRLDAGASGAVAFATSKSAAKGLGQQFAERSASRTYHAIVVGQVPKDKGVIQSYLARTGPGIKRGSVSPSAKKAKVAITHYEVLERFETATLMQVHLETGRTHQIRVHFAEMGHPLVGDWLYCPEEFAEKCPPCERLMLHAQSLSIVHPIRKEDMTFTAPYHPYFREYLEKL